MVYTFYNDMGMGGADEIDAWRTSWSDAGWKPVVLSERHAALHPKYARYRALFLTMPSRGRPPFISFISLRLTSAVTCLHRRLSVFTNA